jgi:Putative peptidoglycan binding domain
MNIEGVRHTRRRVLVAGAAVVALAAVAGPAAALAGVGTRLNLGLPFAHGAGASGAGTSADTSASLATVTRRTLTARTQVKGTLGYADSYKVVNKASGTLTWLPAVGQVVKQGDVLYRVDGKPVILLSGSTPAYRSLSAGTRASDVTGPDVAQLNAALVALGYATSAELDPASDQFSWRTKVALQRLQAHLGVEQSGTLALGEAVFLPAAARITTVSGTLGAEAPPGALLEATSTTRVVSVSLNANQQSQVKAGDTVSIALPNGKTTPGTVSSVGTVATTPQGGGTATIPVVITPTDAAATGTLDAAQVQVSITTASAKDALAVPVTALLAQAGGGYAVEVVGGRGGHHLVPVTLGLFDDAAGLVQATGDGLSAGQRVVVPST